MKLGDKVICVKDISQEMRDDMSADGADIPEKDEMYIIDGFTWGGEGLELKGMNSKSRGYDHRAFRKVDENFADNTLSMIEEQINGVETEVERVEELEEVPA